MGFVRENARLQHQARHVRAIERFSPRLLMFRPRVVVEIARVELSTSAHPDLGRMKDCSQCEADADSQVETD